MQDFDYKAGIVANIAQAEADLAKLKALVDSAIQNKLERFDLKFESIRIFEISKDINKAIDLTTEHVEILHGQLKK